jgi:hypothetical protein
MLYECGCGVTIQIAASHFAIISDAELNRLCVYEGSINSPSPWMDSALDTNGDIVQKEYRIKEQVLEKDKGIESIDNVNYEDDEDEDLTPEILFDVEFEE